MYDRKREKEKKKQGAQAYNEHLMQDTGGKALPTEKEVRMRGKKSAVGKERAKQMQQSAAQRREITKVMVKYDDNRDGKLGRDELKCMMQDIAKGKKDCKPPSEEDVDDLLKMTDTSEDGSIDLDEVKWALELWQNYCSTMPKVEPYFLKYDKDRSGALDREELKKLLTELNDPEPVDDEELDEVMRDAEKTGDGDIGRLELQLALTIWYGMGHEAGPLAEPKKKGKGAPRSPRPGEDVPAQSAGGVSKDAPPEKPKEAAKGKDGYPTGGNPPQGDSQPQSACCNIQ